jgi:hypothetical protein
MPYCSLEEAWAPVSNKQSDVYKKDGNSIYPEQCLQQPMPVQKSYSRTNQRQGKHTGPINRIPEYKNQVVKFNQNNERYMADAEPSDSSNFNYENNETPLTSYDREYLEKNENPTAPEHKISMRKKKTQKSRDIDSIDQIIADVEDNISDDDTPHDINRSYKELSSEHDDKNDLIKHLIGQNEKLKTMLKKMDKKPSSNAGGVFNVFDFIIVILLGIIMLIILDYIHRIVLKRV